jgi:hypothetical protein
MRKKNHKLPTVGKKDKNKPVSKQQKEFNRRVKKVNKLQSQLEELEQLLPKISSEYQKKIVPLTEQIVEMRANFVKILDAAYDMKYFRVREKEKIRYLLLEQASELINKHDREELIPIYDKHSEYTYEEEGEQLQDLGKDMAEEMFRNMFGVDMDLDDIDLNDFEEIGRRFQEQMHHKQEKEQARKKKRKKTKAQKAKEEREAQEAKSISKATREIYMKLVREYHPDREKDENKQAEMTAIMQRITEAYKAGDLYQLLRLEMELLQGVEERLNELSDEQLKHYNKLLKEQENELEQKLSALQFYPASPAHSYLRYGENALIALERDQLEFEKHLEGMKYEQTLLADKKELRAFLREIEIENDEDDFGFYFT